MSATNGGVGISPITTAVGSQACTRLLSKVVYAKKIRPCFFIDRLFGGLLVNPLFLPCFKLQHLGQSVNVVDMKGQHRLACELRPCSAHRELRQTAWYPCNVA